MCSVLKTPDMFATEVYKLIFDHVWKYYNAKVKKSTLLFQKHGKWMFKYD